MLVDAAINLKFFARFIQRVDNVVETETSSSLNIYEALLSPSAAAGASSLV